MSGSRPEGEPSTVAPDSIPQATYGEPPEEWTERGYSLSTLKGFLVDKVAEFDVAIENLLRLNLVAFPTAKLGIANGRDVRVQVTSGDILCATNLGYTFTSACGHGRMRRNISYGVPSDSVSNIFWTRGGSLKISPSPSSKMIPLGIIQEDKRLEIQKEAFELAKRIGCSNPAVGLSGRVLIVHVGRDELPGEKAVWLVEFCEDRGLQLEIQQILMPTSVRPSPGETKTFSPSR